MHQISKIFRFFLTFLLLNIVYIMAYGDVQLTDSLSKSDTSKVLDTKVKLRIYKFDIKSEIAPPMVRKTTKAFEEAYKMKADLIILQLNTYGGRLDAADSIRTKLLQSKIPVFVFIDNNAASAGALISIACDSIYMRKGAMIGAATVVDQAGQVVPDKYQSYMRAMMRSTAIAKNRDPNIAQAMVDPSIAIPGVIDTGKVLTLTTDEAIKNGFCEGEAESISEVLKLAGIQEYEIVEQKLSAVDKIIGFFLNPFISGILIMLIIGGIYFELQTPGVGFPLAAAAVAAILYFVPLYLDGLAEHWEILVFIAGVILLAVEIFVFPGFGVAGISGIILIFTGLTLGMVNNMTFDFTGVRLGGIVNSFLIVIIASFSSILLSFFISRRLFSAPTNIFGELALHDTQQLENGYVGTDANLSVMLGKTGIAATNLRPVGKIEIENDFYDATAETGFIPKGEKIVVVKYETAQLVVRKA